MKKLLWLLPLALLLCACSFGKTSSIYNAETMRVEAAAQFAVTLPADWEIYADETTSFAAVSPQGDVGISVIAEFAGFTFYNTAELAAKATENIELSNLEVIEESDSQRGKQYTQVLRYTDSEGVEGILYNYVYNPYTSVVYYVFMTCAEADYAFYAPQMREMAESFMPLLSQREYYDMIDGLQESVLTEEEE